MCAGGAAGPGPWPVDGRNAARSDAALGTFVGGLWDSPLLHRAVGVDQPER